MAESLNQTSFAALLKQLYPGGVPYDLAMKNHPYMYMVGKYDDFEGSTMEIPIYFENPMGRSAKFTDAQNNTNPSQSVKWSLPIKEDHGIITIDALTIRKSRSNMGAFVRARQTEIDMMLQQLGNSASHALYRDGGGSLGELASVTAATPGAGFTQFVFEKIQDTRFVAIGQTLVFGPNKDGSSLRGSGTGATFVGQVTAVDETAGSFDVEFVADASIVAGDFSFVQGDPGLKFDGIQSYIPLVAPLVGSDFLGVDRGVQPTRLAGQRRATPGTTIKENILRITEEIVRQGGNPGYVFIGHTQFSNLVTDLGDNFVRYYGAGGSVDWGWSYVEVYTSAGPVKVVPDADQEECLGHVLDMDTWRFHHLDGFPHIDTIDGNNALRQSNADGIEVRGRYWGNLTCIAPGRNGVFELA